MKLLNGIEDINAPTLGLEGYSTTYLYQAVDCDCRDAVRLLLQKGAGPNFHDQDSILIGLQS